jgi:transmembrane sensor
MRAGDIDAGSRRRFDAWLRRSPEHVRAYLEISEIWDDARLVDPERKCSSNELIARGRDKAEVVHLPISALPDASHGASGLARVLADRLPRRGHLVAAAVIVICFLVAVIELTLYRVQMYTTNIGELRSVTLADGSRVEMNSCTRLRVRLTARERTIELLQGQALFDVAKNPSRPFTVVSGGVQVRAIGTQFDVDRRKRATVVTVLEGRVTVSEKDQQSAMPNVQFSGYTQSTAMVVGTGEQVTLRGSATPHPVAADVAAATAWTHGSLIFEGTRLSDVIEEFNRHNARQLSIRDAALEDLRISGVYSSTNPDLLLRFLRQQPGIGIQETSDGALIFSTTTQ